MNNFLSPFICSDERPDEDHAGSRCPDDARENSPGKEKQKVYFWCSTGPYSNYDPAGDDESEPRSIMNDMYSRMT
jgi:hypothetical protein